MILEWRHRGFEGAWLRVGFVAEELPVVFVFRVVALGVDEVVSLMSLTVLGFMLVLGTLVQFLGHQSTFLRRVVGEDIVGLHLWQVELLWTKDRPRSGDTDPANEGLGWDLIVLHRPQANESSCSSKACFAVDSDCLIRGPEMIFRNIQEIFHDMVWRV